MSLIAYSEVYEGVLGARDVEAALRGLTQFLIGVPILRPDRATAERFADIRSQLRGRGELLADQDTWIAATALRYDLVLVSRDGHFDRIPNLKRLRG